MASNDFGAEYKRLEELLKKEIDRNNEIRHKNAALLKRKEELERKIQICERIAEQRKHEVEETRKNKRKGVQAAKITMLSCQKVQERKEEVRQKLTVCTGHLKALNERFQDSKSTEKKAKEQARKNLDSIREIKKRNLEKKMALGEKKKDFEALKKVEEEMTESLQKMRLDNEGKRDRIAQATSQVQENRRKVEDEKRKSLLLKQKNAKTAADLDVRAKNLLELKNEISCCTKKCEEASKELTEREVQLTEAKDVLMKMSEEVLEKRHTADQKEQQVQALEKETKAIAAATEGLKAKYAELTAVRDELVEEKTKVLEKIKSVREENANLEENLSLLVIAEKQLQKDLDKVVQDVEDEEKQSQEQLEKNEAIQKRLDESQLGLIAAQQRLKELEAELASEEETSRKLTAKLEEARDIITAQDKRKELLEASIRDTNVAAEEVMNRRKQVQDQIQETKDQLKEKQSALEVLEEKELQYLNLAEKCKELKEERAMKEKEAEKLEVEVSDMETNKASLEAELSNLKDEESAIESKLLDLQVVEAEIKELKQIHDDETIEYEAKRKNVQELEMEKAILDEKIASLSICIKETEDSVAELNKSISEVKLKLKELDEIEQKEVHKLTENLARIQKTNDDVTAELAEKQKELADERAVKLNLEEDYQKLTEMKSQVASKLAANENALKIAQESLGDLRAQVGELETEPAVAEVLRKKRSELDLLEAENKRVEDEIKIKRLEVDSGRKNLEAVTAVRKNKEERLQGLQAELDQENEAIARLDIDKTQAEIEKLRSNIQGEQLSLANFKQVLHGREEECKILSVEEHRLRKQVAETNAEIEEIQKERQEIANKLLCGQQQLTAVNKKEKSLLEEIEKLNSRLDNTRNEEKKIKESSDYIALTQELDAIQNAIAMLQKEIDSITALESQAQETRPVLPTETRRPPSYEKPTRQSIDVRSKAKRDDDLSSGCSSSPGSVILETDSDPEWNPSIKRSDSSRGTAGKKTPNTPGRRKK